jgi:hypothetical protein
VFDPEMVTFLESGCSTLVGTVDADGEPHAGRGWGLTVSSGDSTVRLVIDAGDEVGRRHLSEGGLVAVTGADVRTLRSVQLKGRALAVEPATDADRARARRFCDAFFADVTEVDGTERALLERLVPSDFAVCLVEVDEVFDQTPGPEAGARLTVGQG